MTAKRTQRDLFERCIDRGIVSTRLTGHIRAELRRVARQVRKLDGTQCQLVLKRDVLAVLKEAQR